MFLGRGNEGRTPELSVCVTLWYCREKIGKSAAAQWGTLSSTGEMKRGTEESKSTTRRGMTGWLEGQLAMSEGTDK